jgi:hypothetical protein
MDRVLQSEFDGREQHPAGEQLLLYVDGELAASDAARIRAHLEACWRCRARVGKVETAIGDFMAFDVALAESAAPPSGGAFQTRLRAVAEERGAPPLLARLRALFAMETSWPWRAGIAVAVLMLVMAAAMWTTGREPARAESILKQAVLRERGWKYQPDKVLHWVTETAIAGNSSLPDGHYRTEWWQNNHRGQAGAILRKYDSRGTLVWARQDRPDGSEVVFDHLRGDVATIEPATADLKSYAEQAGLGEHLAAILRDRERVTSTDVDWARTLDYVQESLRKGHVEEVQDAVHGRVYRIHSDAPERGLTMENDIAADDFQLIRKATERKLAGGKIAREESRLVSFNESTVAEFEGNGLRAELERARQVIRLSPEELIRRMGAGQSKGVRQ